MADFSGSGTTRTAAEAMRSLLNGHGLCGHLSADGSRACALPPGHELPHATDVVSDLPLEAWEQLDLAATPGEWTWFTNSDDQTFVKAGNDRMELDVEVYSHDDDRRCELVQQQNDAMFIAAARTAVPELIAEVRRLRDVPQAVSDPDDRIRELVKAGALIAAEIDRLRAPVGEVCG